MQKDLRKALEPFLKRSWVLERRTKHYRMSHAEYGYVSVSSTASCPFHIKHIIADLKRAEMSRKSVTSPKTQEMLDAINKVTLEKRTVDVSEAAKNVTEHVGKTTSEAVSTTAEVEVKQLAVKDEVQKRRQHVSLSPKDNFMLCKMLQEDYTSSGLSDAAFAEHASKLLGCEVNAKHVYTRRVEFEIPSNSRRASEPIGLEERLDNIEKLLKKIIDMFEK